MTFTKEDVRVLEMAEYRYGFCPRTESCGGCERCQADWARFLTIRQRIEALLPHQRQVLTVDQLLQFAIAARRALSKAKGTP